MSFVSVPTLTSEGYVSDPDRKIDRLLAAAFASDASQSNIFRQGVTSVQAIIASAGQDMELLERALQDALQSLFQRYFDAADIRVNLAPVSDASPYRYGIEVQSGLVQGGKKYNLARSGLLTKDGVLAKLVPITYNAP